MATIRHKPKAGAKLTGTEWEAADTHEDITIAGEDITSGTVADARIASTIARDSEVTAAIAALSSVYQPLDSDLTAIAALSTTAFGRALLALADADALAAATGLTGLPEQWTDGGNGNVTAEADAGNVPLTVVAPADPTHALDITGPVEITQKNANRNGLLRLTAIPGSSANDTDLFYITAEDGTNVMIQTANGGLKVTELDAGEDGIRFISHGNRLTLGDFGDGQSSHIYIDSPSPQFFIWSSAGIHMRWDVDGNVVLRGTHAAPADGALAAGELGLWFDQTNGAPKLGLKGKTADGTVVSTELWTGGGGSASFVSQQKWSTD